MILVSILLLTSIDANAFGPYYAGCNGFQDEAQDIASVFGESRVDSGYTIPNRFHAGIDIDDSNCGVQGHSVEAIEAGYVTVPPFPSCKSGGPCIRITSIDGSHAFDYVDITSTFTAHTYVGKGDTFGQIANAGEGSHLHLNEIQGLGVSPNCGSSNPQPNCFRINPQRPNGLQFFDSDAFPNFIALTIGGVDSDIVLVPHSPPIEGGANPVSPFPYIDGTFYVSGQVDILETATAGSKRKGLYQVGAYVDEPGALFNKKGNITFNTLLDKGGISNDVQNIYFSQNGTSTSGSNTFFGTNFLINNAPGFQTQVQSWDTTQEQGGPTSLCGYIKSFPQGFNLASCLNVVIDNSAPSISALPGLIGDGSITKHNVITITGDAPNSGIYSIELTGISYSSTSYVDGILTYSSNTFPDSGVLADGVYSAKVTSLSGLTNSLTFTIAATSPTINAVDSNDIPYFGYLVDTNTVVFLAQSDAAGISSIGAPIGGSVDFDCPSSAAIGPYYGIAPSGLVSATDCAGNISSTTVTRNFMPYSNCMTGSDDVQDCAGSVIDYYQAISSMTAHFYGLTCYMDGTDPSCSDTCDNMVVDCSESCFNNSIGISSYTTEAICSEQPPTTLSFTVSDDLDSSFGGGFSEITSVYSVSDGATSPTEVFATFPTPTTPAFGTVTLPSPITPISIPGHLLSSDGVIAVNTYYSQLSVPAEQLTPPMTSALVEESLRPLGSAYKFQGAAFAVKTSTVGFGVSVGTMSFTITPPSGVSVDTTTLQIYQFNGTSWSATSIANQIISLGLSGVIVASGTFSSSAGDYALLFSGADSSAPITTSNFQATSQNAFGGTIFLSTDAYAVLVATDPSVNGWASGIATTTYRLNSSSGLFSVYTSSIPLPIGVNVLQYQSQDYAGNLEPLHTSTFIVTGGTLQQETGNYSSLGNFLLGFLNNGITSEVQSRAQNFYTLQISSPDFTPMFNVDYLGSIGVTQPSPLASFDIQGSTNTGDIALRLRSGNSTSTSSSDQVRFCYNGGPSMCHAITTNHKSSGNNGNRMDFWLWAPVAGSTTSAANIDALSLQLSSTSSSGVSVQIRPVGSFTGDVELEVSNGITVGGGTIHRAAAGTPSSRKRKSDIRYLSATEEAAAYQDVMALKPASYRYKGDPTPWKGLILEDSPRSIQGPGGAIIIDDRIANLEMAVKEASEKIQKLKQRLKELEK